MKYFLIPFIGLLAFMGSMHTSYSQDRYFFNEDWEQTSEAEATYYRKWEQLGDSLFLVKDYFMNGAKQMIAYAKDQHAETMEGHAIYYFENEQVEREGNYQKGEQHGEWKYWYDNGQLKAVKQYHEGSATGKYVSFHKNGQQDQVGQFSDNGSRIGDWTRWHDNQQMESKLFYTEKGLSGDFLAYYPNGKVSKEMKYRDGVRGGEWIYWYPNGQMRAKGSYDGWSKIGAWTKWWENGQLLYEGGYWNGMMDGKWNWYRNDGTKAAREKYEKGELEVGKFYDQDESLTRKIKGVKEEEPYYSGDFRQELYTALEETVPEGVAGTGIVKVIIDSTGAFVVAPVLDFSDPVLAKALVKAVQRLEKWHPGTRHNFRVNYVTNIRFHVSDDGKTIIDEYQFAAQDPILRVEPTSTLSIHPTSGETETYTIVEDPPQFPGGEQAMRRFLGKHIQYPQIAKDAGAQGTVYIKFVVLESGMITGYKLLRGVHPAVDEEALRVVQSMPFWTAGRQDGKQVRVFFNLPIRFTLR